MIFGAGRLDTLSQHARGLGKKALIVTGKNSAKLCGALPRALPQLPGAALYDKVPENPTTAACEEGARLCRGEGCDFVVAIGGGSPIDAAKAIAVLACNDGACKDFFGTDRFLKALPIVAVPTTAGTGSEVTPYAVLVDEGDGHYGTKQTISGRSIFPTLAILDPDLTLTLPRHATIATGLDALSQGMEGIVSKKATPMTDIIALEVCRIVRQWLPRAARDGADKEARAQMLYAAMLSGWVVAHTQTTLVHGMGYYFTLDCGVAHGLANALLLTPLFQYNAQIAPGKVGEISRALGVPCKKNPEDASKGIGEAIHSIFSDLGLSPSAEKAGVTENALPALVEGVWRAKSRFRNQIGELSKKDVRALFEQSFRGALKG